MEYYINTEKVLETGLVNKLINDLNKKVFNEIFTIVYYDDKSGRNWGHHTWLLSYGENKFVVYYTMNKLIKVSVASGQFYYWVSELITNELALNFNGKISNEQYTEETLPIKSMTFVEYLVQCLCKCKCDKDVAKRVIDFEKLFVPEKFLYTLPEIEERFLNNNFK